METVQVTCPNCKVKRRSYYRKAALPMARIGPVGAEFDRLPDRAYVLDLSMTGMRMKAEQAPSERFLNIRFNLPPQDETVTLIGEVVWIKALDTGGFAFGVHFTQLDAYTKKLLGFFLMA